MAEVSEKKGTLFVGGLAYHVEESDLKNYFSHFGQVFKLVLLRDKSTNASKGYAFITMAAAVAERITRLKHSLFGRRIECQFASKKADKQKIDTERRRKKLFVSHIPSSMSNQDLEAFFSNFGRVHNSYIIQSIDAQTNRPYGFVEFEYAEDAEALLSRGSEVFYNGCRLVLQPFKERQKQLIGHTASGNSPATSLIYHENHISDLHSEDQSDHNYSSFSSTGSWQPASVSRSKATAQIPMTSCAGAYHHRVETNYRFNQQSRAQVQ